MLFYAEDHTTQHMETLLQGLYKASQDENEQVVKQVAPYILQSANFPLQVETETKRVGLDLVTLIFAEYVPLASQNTFLIFVYPVAQ